MGQLDLGARRQRRHARGRRHVRVSRAASLGVGFRTSSHNISRSRIAPFSHEAVCITPEAVAYVLLENPLRQDITNLPVLLLTDYINTCGYIDPNPNPKPISRFSHAGLSSRPWTSTAAATA